MSFRVLRAYHQDFHFILLDHNNIVRNNCVVPNRKFGFSEWEFMSHVLRLSMHALPVTLLILRTDRKLVFCVVIKNKITEIIISLIVTSLPQSVRDTMHGRGYKCEQREWLWFMVVDNKVINVNEYKLSIRNKKLQIKAK